MPLDVGAVVRDGAARTVERNGRLLMGPILAIKLATVAASQTLFASGVDLFSRLQAASDVEPAFDPTVFEAPTPLALPIPFGAALSLVIVVAVAAEGVRIVGVRTFASDHTGTIPREFVGRRIGRATLAGVVAGLLVIALVVAGTVLLVVPGVFLGLVFFFVRQEIAVEDKGVIDAMAGSWDLTGGHRIQLFWLAAIVFGVGTLNVVPGLVLGLAAPAVSALATAVVSTVTTVFGIAVASRAYARLRADRAERFGVEPGEETAFVP